MEITLHTSPAGERCQINIEWFDENSVHHRAVLHVNVEAFDKPRTLTILLGETLLAQMTNRGMTFGPGTH